MGVKPIDIRDQKNPRCKNSGIKKIKRRTKKIKRCKDSASNYI